MRRCILALVSCLALAWLLPAPADAEHVYASKRLRITGDVREAWIERAAQLGEALWGALEKHFGRPPAGASLPLELVLYPDRARYEKALGRSSRTERLGHEGGWTDWETGTSHVWIQHRPFDTRRLILHELVHQFYGACRERARRGSGPWWYREGLAEWFGWHRLRGKAVEFGAFDVLTLNGTVHTIAQRNRGLALQPWRIVHGAQGHLDYAHALAVVAVLMEPEHPELHRRFRAWELELLRKGGGTKAFARHFEGQAPRLRAATAAFWRRHEPTWKPERGSWGEAGGVLTAVPGSGDAFLRRTDLDYVTSLAAEVRIPTADGPLAGVLAAAGRLPWGFRVELSKTEVRIVRANPPDGPRARQQGPEEVLARARHGQTGFAALAVHLTPGSDVLGVRCGGLRLEARIGTGLGLGERRGRWEVELRKDWGLWARGAEARFRSARAAGERSDDGE